MVVEQLKNTKRNPRTEIPSPSVQHTVFSLETTPESERGFRLTLRWIHKNYFSYTLMYNIVSIRQIEGLLPKNRIRLNNVKKSSLPFIDSLSCTGLLIAVREPCCFDQSQDNNQALQSDSHARAYFVAGVVLLTEGWRTKRLQCSPLTSGGKLHTDRCNDTANATKADLESWSICTLTLTTDVVGLVCKDSRDVALCTSAANEGSCETNCVLWMESSHGKARDGEQGEQDDLLKNKNN